MNRENLLKKESVVNIKQLNKKLILANIFMLVGFFGLQIFITSFVGTKTQEIDYTRNQKNELRRQNSFLEAEVAKEKSVTQALKLVQKYNLVEKNVNFMQEANLQGVALNYKP